MKKITLFTLFVCSFSYSQIIDGFDIRTSQSEYVDVYFDSSPIVSPRIDFGFGQQVKVKKKTSVTFEGKSVRLKTSSDFINFFTKYGYELVDENSKSRTFGTPSSTGGTIINTRTKSTIRFKNNN